MSLLQTAKIQFLRLGDNAFKRWLLPRSRGQSYLSLLIISTALGLIFTLEEGRLRSAEAWVILSAILIGHAAVSRTTMSVLASVNALVVILYLLSPVARSGGVAELESLALAFLLSCFVHWVKLGQLYKIFCLELDASEREQQFSELKADAQLIVDRLTSGVYLFKTSHAEGLLAIHALHAPLFQDELKTTNAQDALDETLKASGHKLETIEAWKTLLAKSIGDTILQWDFNSAALPKELRVKLGRGTRVVSARWDAVHTDDGIVRKIVLLLDDVTELRMMYEDSLSRSDDAKRLMELISNSPRKMGEFFALAESVLHEGKTAMIVGHESATLNFRNIHTLKGMARGYQLTELSDCFHALEETLQSQALSKTLSLQHLPSFQACEISLRNYKKLFLKAYTRQISSNQVTVDPKLVLDLSHQIETAYVRSDIETAFHALNEIRAIFASTLDKIVIDEISMLRKLADDLDKPHPNLYINELDIQLTEAGKITLRKVFVHLFRNSIDHGIESESERESKGKAGRGQISIHTAPNRDSYRITYRDDGQGLALRKILKKAIELGMADADRCYSNKEMAELIFQSGVSTAGQSNPISGRGVGMDAIRSFLRQEGGNIAIELDPMTEEERQTFSFIIDIPMKKEQEESIVLKKAV